MFRKSIKVELATAQGVVFSSEATTVELRTGDGTVLVIPRCNAIISMVGQSTIALRSGSEFTIYQPSNGSAGLKGRRLTILAEEIVPLDAAMPEIPPR